MAQYSGVQKEHQLKNLVFDDFFDNKIFSWEQEVDNIDFIITGKKNRGDLFGEGPGSSRHYLWAEAKKGTHDIFDMYTQLILTCKKTYEKGDHFAPPWLGCFDEARIPSCPSMTYSPFSTKPILTGKPPPAIMKRRILSRPKKK